MALNFFSLCFISDPKVFKKKRTFLIVTPCLSTAGFYLQFVPAFNNLLSV